MSEQKVLVIEDDRDIAELVEYNLSREGYQVTRAYTGEEGLQKAKTIKPDLILLDLMLPGLDGLDVCRSLKRDSDTDNIPIIMLTAKSEEADIVAGLEIGADDYISKPFSPRVLLARIHAVMRRKSEPPPEGMVPLSFRDLSIDPGRHEVRVAGTPITLTSTEFRLLHFLAQRPGWVFTRDQIMDSTHGEDTVVTDRSIDVHIAGLRKKMGPCGKYIETVRGVGYRFHDPETA
ncbi:MAG: response regulator transcription factor [candidate division Zixibacteria bacterium]|nr:response regulator transcription factor [candidate division Zixibacteria bacterium]